MHSQGHFSSRVCVSILFSVSHSLCSFPLFPPHQYLRSGIVFPPCSHPYSSRIPLRCAYAQIWIRICFHLNTRSPRFHPFPHLAINRERRQRLRSEIGKVLLSLNFVADSVQNFNFLPLFPPVFISKLGGRWRSDPLSRVRSPLNRITARTLSDTNWTDFERIRHRTRWRIEERY